MSHPKVYTIDAATNRVTGTAAVTGTNLGAVAVSPDSSRVYVGVSGPDRVVAIDAANAALAVDKRALNI
jgi:DNA-binding beta-propeller fold protein YncE